MKHRLVTRSDFDGLVCAVLLRHLDLIDEIVFVHPKQIQDGSVEITDRDILTNLPYAEGAHVVFDHHASEVARVGGVAENHVIMPSAPSAARVVYEYYGGAATFPMVSTEMMTAVDIADSGAYDVQEVLYPVGWTLLNFLMDSRTGLGRFHHFQVSNYQLMMKLIDVCATEHDIETILADPDVVERTALYRDHANRFTDQLRRRGRMVDDVVVVDLRDQQITYAGNRFMIYALFPLARYSVHVIPGRGGVNTVLAVGRSIVDRSGDIDVGQVMLDYGGGGHRTAGSCQVDNADANRVLKEIVTQIGTPLEVDALLG